MKEASLGNLGIERSLNQSIRFMDQDLSAYLDMTEQMIKSIDRIIDKVALSLEMYCKVNYFKIFR